MGVRKRHQIMMVDVVCGGVYKCSSFEFSGWHVYLQYFFYIFLTRCIFFILEGLGSCFTILCR